MNPALENPRKIILIRGRSGSGKTTFANFIQNLYFLGLDCKSTTTEEDCILCCADDYYTDSAGNYNFDPKELSAAHAYCRNKFLDAVINGIELVIVANTGAAESEIAFYLDKGKEFGYKVFSIVIENRHGGVNSHNVPLATLKRQEERLRSSLKL